MNQTLIQMQMAHDESIPNTHILGSTFLSPPRCKSQSMRTAADLLSRGKLFPPCRSTPFSFMSPLFVQNSDEFHPVLHGMIPSSWPQIEHMYHAITKLF